MDGSRQVKSKGTLVEGLFPSPTCSMSSSSVTKVTSTTEVTPTLRSAAPCWLRPWARSSAGNLAFSAAALKLPVLVTVVLAAAPGRGADPPASACATSVPSSCPPAAAPARPSAVGGGSSYPRGVHATAFRSVWQ